MTHNSIFWLDEKAPVGAILQADYRTSKLTLARFVHDDEDTVIRSKSEDAMVAVMHLSHMPENMSSFCPRGAKEPAGPDTAFNFADLRTGPSCRIFGPLDNIHLHIPRAAFDDLADDTDSAPIERLHSPDGWRTVDPTIQSIKQALVGVISKPEETTRLFIDHIMVALHAYLAKAYGGMREATRLRPGRLAPWQERLAKELIAANLTRELTLIEIADRCRLSLSYFIRAFKASTGYTPHQWLQQLRIEKAQQLMGSDLGLAQVALACGFADQSHFTRVFARVVGSSPGVWRRCRHPG